MRKICLAIATTATVAAAALLPTGASAHGWHHHGRGYGGVYIGFYDAYASCYGYVWRQDRWGFWHRILVRYHC